MKHEIAHRVHAKEIHQGICVEHVALGLAHLTVALQQPWMAKYLLGKGHIQGHQENGPVDGVESDDILANQMKVSGPVLLKLVCTAAVTIITNTGDIVGQGIQPYIGHMLRVKINGDAPAEGGPGHAQILKSRKKEVVHHLILPGYGLDELRMLIDILDQPGSVLAHAEEIRLLLGWFYLASAVRTLAVHQLGLGEKGLAGSAVQSLVISLIDITLVVKLLENLLHLGLMVLVRGADKLIIGSVHQIPNPLYLSCCLVHELLGSHTCCLSLFFNLLSMLVRTCLEEHVISLLPLISGYAVSQNDFIGIADMRLAGSIGNGRGNIIWLFTILTHMINSLFF